MQDLIKKLEAAPEGSWELDLDVAIFLGEFRIESNDTSDNALWDLRGEREVFCGSEVQWKYDCSKYTTSLDAKLPWENITQVSFHNGMWEAWQETNLGVGHTEPLARRIAALKSKSNE